MGEITQRLRLWRSGFVNIRLVYEQRCVEVLEEGEWRPNPRKSLFRDEWIWADCGALRHETTRYDGTELDYRNVLAMDGRKLQLSNADYRDQVEHPGFLTRLELRRMSAPQPRSIRGIVPLSEVYHASAGAWVGDCLGEKGTLNGYKDVEGKHYAHVSSRGMILWLDPQHDFLVKRIDWRGSPQEEMHRVFEVEAFQQVDGIWFPKCGWDERGDERWKWEVLEVSLNSTLGPELFEPPAPMVGTIVDDAVVGRIYKYRGEGWSMEMREREIAQQAKQKRLTPNEKVADMKALSSRLLWWSISLLAFTLVLLPAGAAILFWRRKS